MAVLGAGYLGLKQALDYDSSNSDTQLATTELLEKRAAKPEIEIKNDIEITVNNEPSPKDVKSEQAEVGLVKSQPAQELNP